MMIRSASAALLAAAVGIVSGNPTIPGHLDDHPAVGDRDEGQLAGGIRLRLPRARPRRRRQAEPLGCDDDRRVAGGISG